MAGDINRVFLIGRLTRDPEMSVLQKSNTSIAKFSLANNRVFVTGGEKKDQTSFFNCIAWGKLGELIAEYCKKGHRLAVEGRLQQRSWEDNNGNKRSTVEIVVENCQFLSPKGTSSSDSYGSNAESFYEGGSPDYSGPSDTDHTPFTDDDIPF